MATRMQQRRGTAAQWTAANPVLAAGEIGFETDTNKFKMGNGSSTWTALQYFANAAELAAIIDGAPDLLNTLNELAASIGDDPAFFTNISNSISGSITQHNNDTTNVHGIADTSALATTSGVTTTVNDAISAHSGDTTSVHGIADTSVLVTATNLSDSISSAMSTHASDTTSVHGIADTSVLATATDVSDAVAAEAIVTAGNLTAHNVETENVHGIADTTALVTQTDLTNAISGAEVDQSTLAGVGLDWNSVDTRFDIDSTVATKTYADDAVSTHNSDTTSVHGIADTSLLATTAYADTAEADAITAAGTAADTKIATAVAALTKSSVGLGNVDNTTDANKPVSTATQTALDLKADLAGATFTGDVTVETNLIVDGNFTVTGTTTTVETADLVVTDPMIYMGEGNTANLSDLGFVASFNDGTYQHAGLVRDSSASTWKLFKGVTDEPTTTVNFAQGSLDALAVGALAATTVTPSSGVVFSDGTQTKEGVPSRTPIIAKTDSYTLSALTERDSLIEVAKATATTITIPTDATLNFPIGTSIDILQTSTGQVTIAGAAGTTVNATPGLKLRTTWSSATLFKRAANTWVVYGDLTA
jgi:hypothetical protein